MNQVIIPENYHSVLSMYETQDAIGIIKEMMQKKLCMALRLKRVTAPLFVDPASGLNDDLNGVERPVSFEIPAAGVEAQVVHSLAKWKRMALYRYDFRVGKGILTDMNAIRRDEELDNLHSLRGSVGLGESHRPQRPQRGLPESRCQENCRRDLQYPG